MNLQTLVGWVWICIEFGSLASARAQSATPARSLLPEASAKSTASQSHGPQPIPSGPLGDVDQLFMDSYFIRRSTVMGLTSPFVVVSGSDLILHRKGGTEKARVIPNVYHALKDVAHVPFAIYLQLSFVAGLGSDLSEEQLNEMTLFRTRIEAARSALSTGDFTPIQANRCASSMQNRLARKKTPATNSEPLLSMLTQALPFLPILGGSARTFSAMAQQPALSNCRMLIGYILEECLVNDDSLFKHPPGQEECRFRENANLYTMGRVRSPEGHTASTSTRWRRI
jgi:hypothetical protein